MASLDVTLTDRCSASETPIGRQRLRHSQCRLQSADLTNQLFQACDSRSGLWGMLRCAPANVRGGTLNHGNLPLPLRRIATKAARGGIPGLKSGQHQARPKSDMCTYGPCTPQLDACANSMSLEMDHWGDAPAVSPLASVQADRGHFLVRQQVLITLQPADTERRRFGFRRSGALGSQG